MAARGKSTRGGGGRKTEATPERPPLELVVGFDAEWVNANRADDSLPTTDNVLISWQLAVVLPNGKLLSRIFYAEGDTRRHRLSLIKMLNKALFDARENGDIKALPPEWRITIAGHFLRADLTTVREFPKLKTRVDSVRKTFTTVTKPVVATVLGRKATIYFADTLLLSPKGSSLKKLGEVIGRSKVELPDGAIERMDLLRKNDPALFEKYAAEDAIIAASYYLRICEILQHGLGVEDRVATLGGAGVHMIKAALAELDVAPDRYFGYERREGARHWLPCLAEITPFAANCYHGARNEAYRIGFTHIGTRLYDLDLRGAYTTAMALMRVPDWESAHVTTDIKQLAVIGEAMTFARVRFEFPADTRCPSLPVRAGARGLVYPLRGVSWCCGAELVVALSQGAKIVVEGGWRVEWEPDSPRPFEAFTRRINDIRKHAKAAGNALLDQTAKECARRLQARTQARLPMGGVRGVAAYIRRA